MQSTLQEQPTEFHSFEVDPKIVNDLIFRQNGTISTALRELVMNAFDANSDKVEILLWPEGFEVKDTGAGFEDEASIMRNFKTFGTPHVEGDVPFGRFRIGRGQVMAFAKTTWHSKTYKMSTDVKSRDAGFNFQKDAEQYDGCHVLGKFYKPLDERELYNTVSDLSTLVRYSPWPVFINQIQVNAQDGVKWDYEDELLKIRFNPKGRYGINLYSMGILVKELHMHRYGTAADVVTKQAMQLNMARNEINEHDPLWLHVHKVLRAELRKKQAGKNKMAESERHALIDQFCFEEIGFADIAKLPLLKDVRGKLSSFDTEMRKRRPWSVCEDNQVRVADRISTQGNAFVITRSELDVWRVRDLQELIDGANANMGEGDQRVSWYHGLLLEVEVVPFDKLSAGVDDKATLLPLNDLTALERAQRNALQYTVGNMAKRLEKLNGDPIGKRKVHIGVAHAAAWTDSASYVAVERTTLSYFDNGMPGLTQLAAILLHELTHQEGNSLGNGHDMAFYQSFHDSVLSGPIQREVLGNGISSLRNQYQTELENANLPFPKWLLDRDEEPIIITLTSKNPTPLLAWFLNLIAVPFVKRQGKIELQARGRQIWDIRENAIKRISAAMKKQGLPEVRYEDFSHLGDHKARAKAYDEARFPQVKALLAKDGVTASDEAIRIVDGLRGSGFGYSCPFGGLSALVRDDAFGVKCLHKESLRTVKIMSGRAFSYSSNYRGNWNYRDVTAESFVDCGKEGRFAHYKEMLQQLVDGIADPAERAEFADRVFNDRMKKSLQKCATED